MRKVCVARCRGDGVCECVCFGLSILGEVIVLFVYTKQKPEIRQEWEL